MQIINLASYDERVNKNGNPYLVVKDTNNDTYMCKDARYFNVIKTSSIVNAEVQVETGSQGAIFRTIIVAESLQAGELPKTQPKTYGGGSGGGGGGSYKADPHKQAYIIRQSCLDRGYQAAIALMEKGAIEATEEALHKTAMRFTKADEAWVREATPVSMDSLAPAPAPQAPPVQQSVPQPVATPVASTLDDDLPF